MAWVTWRQHRLQLLVGSGVLAALGVAALVSGLPILAAYHRDALASCLPPSTRSGCDLIVRHFESQFGGGADVARFLILLPALVGVFVGAPLLARELEHGTYRLAWTQSVTRRRWVLSKTLLLAAAAAIGASAVAGLAMWWRHPFDVVSGRMSPGGFEVEGLVVPSYTVFALALGVLAGVVLRRTIPAMSVTLLGFFAARLVVGRFLRPHYLTPLHEKLTGIDARVHSRDWVLSNSLVDAVGRRIATGREDLAILHAQNARIDPQEYLLSLGWRRAVSFQPADRFWIFQSIEAAIFIGLAAAIVLVTLWFVRRTPS
jgi:ABC-2 family transporter protein